MPVIARPLPTRFRPVMCSVMIIQQGIERSVCNQHHMPPVPPIPAIGSATRHKFLTPEGNTTVSSMPTLHLNDRLINEQGCSPQLLLNLSKQLFRRFKPWIKSQRLFQFDLRLQNRVKLIEGGREVITNFGVTGFKLDGRF